ncbi:MAG TPA: CBS domain-containing protein [Holophagaceae bacterium]|nr:CBS domain-containing protein [Holophagaceae bacterium]
MSIRELSPTYVASCRPDATLASAAALLDEHDCGILPVVDDAYRVIGVLTDRDICMALAAHPSSVPQLRVRDVMSPEVHCIGANDTPAQAMRAMRTHHVHRLPITTADGVLEGILSLNDLALAAQEVHEDGRPGPTLTEVALTLKALCAHHRRNDIVPKEQLIRI